MPRIARIEVHENQRSLGGKQQKSPRMPIYQTTFDVNTSAEEVWGPTLDLVATIEEVSPGRLLTWRGHVGAPWLFEGYRRFEIHAAEGRRVRVTHVEDIHGVPAPLFAVVMGGPIQRSHDALNHALRTRVESLR
jgi:hypothetical protein